MLTDLTALYHSMWAETTNVRQPVNQQNSVGTPMISCGMVCTVQDSRDLVVTTLDCPGLTRSYRPPPLPISRCVSALTWMCLMRILEYSLWTYLWNNTHTHTHTHTQTHIATKLYSYIRINKVLTDAYLFCYKHTLLMCTSCYTNVTYFIISEWKSVLLTVTLRCNR